MDVSKMEGLDDFEKSLAAEQAERDRDGERRERKHRHRRHRDEENDQADRDRNRDRDRDRDRDGHRSSRRSHHHHHSGESDRRREERDKDGHRHSRHRRERDHDDDEHRHKRSRREHHYEEEGDRRHHEDRHSHKTSDPKEDLPIPDEEKPLSENAVDVPKSSAARDSWMVAPSAIDIDYKHRPKQRTPPPKSPPRPQRVVHARELNKHLNDEEFLDAKLAPGKKERTVDYKFGDEGSAWRMAKLRNTFAAAEEDGKAVEDVARERYGSLEDFDDAREEKEELERRRLYGADYDLKEKPTGHLYQSRVRDIRKGETPLGQQKPTQGTIIPDEVPAAAQAIDQTALNRLRAQMMKAKLRRAPNAAQLEEEYQRAAAAFASNGPPEAVVVGAMESRLLAGTRGEVKAVTTRRGRERGNVEENEDMTIEDMVREERRTKGQAGGEALRQAERIAKDVKYTDDLDYMDDNAAKLAKRVHKNETNLKNMAISELQKVSPGGAIIVPLTHRKNLLECDDDEWEELRNFMKSLTRMYHAQGRDKAAEAGGMGRSAFRRSIAKEMPYFHVWFTLDGGLGHIVEDGGGKWPKGDIFAREVIAGIVGAEPHIAKKQGRWVAGGEGARVERFTKDWRKYDWTRVLGQ
uniref:Cwf19-like C-terminal domain-containing protein n=1 Tax=Bionectria ochroleuca TaxID=29856 RepID=A0A0B7KMH4_BIOOC